MRPGAATRRRWYATLVQRSRQRRLRSDAIGSQPLHHQRQPVCTARSTARRRAWTAAAVLRPSADRVALVAAQRRPTCLGGLDAHHQVIGTWHVGRPDLIALLQQPGEGMGTAGDAVEPRGDQDRPELAAAGWRRLEARSAIVLAAGGIGVFSDQRPALRRDIGPDAGLLRLQPEPAMALCGG